MPQISSASLPVEINQINRDLIGVLLFLSCDLQRDAAYSETYPDASFFLSPILTTPMRKTMHLIPEEWGQSTVLIPSSGGEAVLSYTADELDGGFRGVSRFHEHPQIIEDEGGGAGEIDSNSWGESFLRCGAGECVVAPSRFRRSK